MNDREDKLIKVGIEEGTEIFFKILDDYPILEDTDPRRDSVLLSLMTNCIVQLHLSGWREKELVNEVFDWCKIAREIEEDDE